MKSDVSWNNGFFDIISYMVTQVSTPDMRYSILWQIHAKFK